MARPVFRFLVMALAALLAYFGPARADGMAALVSDAVGKVEKSDSSGDNWTAAPLMTLVAAGDKIKVAAGGKATLSFVQGGAKAYLTGPCTVSVQSNNVQQQGSGGS